MITQLAHINIVSDQISEMIDFYTEKLGLSIKFTLKGKDGVDFGWYVDCGNRTFIEIFDQKGSVEEWGGEIQQLTTDKKFRHLCFQVSHLDAYKAELESKGLKVSPITVGMDNCKQMWINDPDGNAIELMEYTHNSLQIEG